MNISHKKNYVHGYFMGIKERKKREYEDRKASILKAAEKVFFEKGLDAATIEDIAAEAELAKGTIYRYFKDKEELILTITLKAARIFNSIGDKEIAACRSTWEKMAAAIKSYLIFYHDYPDYFFLFFSWDNIKIDFNSAPAGSIRAEYLKATEAMQLAFLKIIEKGIEEGTIRQIDNPQKTLFIFMNTLFGYFRTLVTRKELIEKRFGYTFDDCINDLIVLVERAFKG